jgi:lipopolysaccharide biosynthesis glycosyltransferase
MTYPGFEPETFGLAVSIANHCTIYDTTSTAKINLMEKTALKIRHLVEAMDEEEISFHEQTARNLVIETGIKRAKRNYNDTTVGRNAWREIELKKPALMGEERVQ